MTARTLEEIEALAADATPGPYSLSACAQGAELMILGGSSRRYVAMVRIHQVPRHMGEWEEGRRAKTAEFLAELPRLLAIAQEQRAVLQEAKAAMRDMLCGWKMIRDRGGEDKIYGIGWDRAQAKVEAALDKIP